MGISKKHHYIPKALLRHFCVTAAGTYYLKKGSTELVPKIRNINSIFFRRHYNSYIGSDGEKDDGLEKFFAFELDNYVPEWIKAFGVSLASGEIAFENKASRGRFVRYFYHHVSRSPEFSEPIVESTKKEIFSEAGLESIEKQFRALSEDERKKFNSTEFQDQITRNARVGNMGSHSQRVIQILTGMKIFVATPARAQKQFIVGSNPVIRFENFPKQHLGSPGVELWTTMTPKIAVGFATPEQPFREVLMIPDNYVRRINTQIAKQSSSIASKSPELLGSLAKAVW